MKKRLSILIFTILLIISMPLTSMAAGWILGNGLWYYLEPSGEMRYAPIVENGLRYYFNGSGACTNPEGEPVTVIGGTTAGTTVTPEVVETAEMTKEEYLEEVDFWLTKFTYASRTMDSFRTALSYGGWQTVMTQASSLSDGLNYLNEIDPPESCTELHDTYLYANVNMISALDSYYDLAEDMSDGFIDPGTMSDYLDYAAEYVSIANYHLGNATQMRQILTLFHAGVIKVYIKWKGTSYERKKSVRTLQFRQSIYRRAEKRNSGHDRYADGSSLQPGRYILYRSDT